MSPQLGRLIPLMRGKDKPTCLMIPGAGGGLAPYLRLAGFLGQTYNVYAVRAAGLVPDEPPETSVQAMTDGVLTALDSLVPDVVFGWSMGGTIAWEVCVALAAHQPRLVMIDCSPFRLPHNPARDEATLRRIVGMLGTRPDENTLARVTQTFHAHVKALTDFETSRRYDGPAQLLVCTGESDLVDRASAIERWQSLAPDLRLGTVPTDHFGVFEPEHLPRLTEPIGEFLEMPAGVAG
ncbi:alpha/beta fold hydrolase [Actinocrispum wychmicini]|uniref:Thioesterase domain-containing protein n=1 Tax=Actinocrispum wychmicini TaxID=1213861 RepID=A0A4R2JPJ7_9PSEU|nr:alpha/beta fold hydrolase [Actinocrispum wychmicini]TCO60692.1 thioesterase domain-containing protein [Actinocrispum wychmicini]